jgi:hypothetical protein
VDESIGTGSGWNLGPADAVCSTPCWFPSWYDASRFPRCSRWVSRVVSNLILVSACRIETDALSIWHRQYAPWFPSSRYAPRFQTRYASCRVPSAGYASRVSSTLSAFSRIPL